jgi:hypothetical protein
MFFRVVVLRIVLQALVPASLLWTAVVLSRCQTYCLLCAAYCPAGAGTRSSTPPVGASSAAACS